MTLTVLPDDLKMGKKSSIQLLEYAHSASKSKTPIRLSKNTFSFILQGSKEIYTHQKTESVSANELLIMRSGNFLVSENTDPFPTYKSFELFVSESATANFLAKLHQQPATEASEQSFLVYRNHRFLQSFSQSLKQLTDTNSQFKSNLLQLRFEELLLNLAEELGLEALSFLLVDAQKSSRFMEVVENNKRNRLSVKELAFLANMSISSFKREFHRTFQTSPAKWFRDQRLEYAAQLLRRKSQRPSDIYEEVGYESLSNFVQAFKAKYGLTPKQYQNH